MPESSHGCPGPPGVPLSLPLTQHEPHVGPPLASAWAADTLTRCVPEIPLTSMCQVSPFPRGLPDTLLNAAASPLPAPPWAFLAPRAHLFSTDRLPTLRTYRVCFLCLAVPSPRMEGPKGRAWAFSVHCHVLRV